MHRNESSSRLVVIDALRGFALFGIFICHMTDYFGLYWTNPQSSWLHEFVISVFNGKAYALFALLFGVSFHIILQSYERKKIKIKRTFSKRLFILFLFGYVHGLIYFGDILSVLALGGFSLLLIYKLPTKTIFIISILLLIQLPMFIQLFIYEYLQLDLTNPIFVTLNNESAEIYKNGSLLDVLYRNALWGQWGKFAYIFEYGRIWKIIGLFLLGFVLGKINLFQRIERFNKFYWICIPASLLLIYVFKVFISNIGEYGLNSNNKLFVQLMFDYHDDTIRLFFGLSIILLSYQINFVQKIFNLLAPCGRLSLTLYIAQAIVGVSIYYNFGLNQYPSITPTKALLLTLGIWVMQVFFAHWWIRHFHYGPLEWVWRSATLLRLDIPFKRKV